MTNCFPTVFKLISENIADNEQPAIFAEIIPKIAVLTQVLLNGSIEHYNAHSSASGSYSETSSRNTAVICMLETFADYLTMYFKHNPSAAASTYKFALDVKSKTRNVNNLPSNWNDSIKEKILKLSPDYQNAIDLRESRNRLSTLEKHLSELENNKKGYTPRGFQIFLTVLFFLGVGFMFLGLADGSFFTIVGGAVFTFFGSLVFWLIPDENKKAKEAEEHIPIVQKDIDELKCKIKLLEEKTNPGTA